MEEREIFYLEENCVFPTFMGEKEFKEYIGYFTSTEKLKCAYQILEEEGIDLKRVSLKTYKLSLTEKQKYVYVLNYEYSIEDDFGNFTDFISSFPPCSSIKECEELKEKLKSEKEYQQDGKKLYSESKDGFHTLKVELDFVHDGIYKKV